MNIGELFKSLDWGSVPDWLAAIGTIGAVAWALHLGLRDGKRLHEERLEARHDREVAAAEREAAAEERALYRQDRADERESERRRLASSVTLIAEKSYSNNPSRHGFYGEAVRWRVHNAGDQPISLVAVVQREIDPVTGEVKGNKEIAAQWTVIEPGGSREALTQLREEQAFHPNREVQFSDGSGVRWQRKSFGALSELDENDPDVVSLMFPTA